jgi:RimJ/RimL family protein N-acetyltransferase
MTIGEDVEESHLMPSIKRHAKPDMARLTTSWRNLEIATARLVLRPPREADLDAIVAEINDFAVVRMLARVPFPYARADAEAFLAWSRESRDDANMVIARSGRAIGCIGLNAAASTCELGYWLGRSHWRQGLATEAGRAFLHFCFETLDMRTVRAGAFSDNPASLRVQQKLGFTITGMSRRASLARGCEVEHIDTVLTRAGFAEATP